MRYGGCAAGTELGYEILHAYYGHCASAALVLAGVAAGTPLGYEISRVCAGAVPLLAGLAGGTQRGYEISLVCVPCHYLRAWRAARS